MDGQSRATSNARTVAGLLIDPALWMKPAGYAMVVLAIALFAASLQWRVQIDLPLMVYIGARVTEGLMPYRDIVDMNMPLVVLFHTLAYKLVGVSDLGYRLLDGAVLLSECGVIWMLLRRVGNAIALVGGGIYAIFHLSLWGYGALQRDYLAVLPLLLAAEFLLRGIEHTARRSLLIAGVMAGIAVMVKPTFLLLGAALPMLLLATEQRTWRQRLGDGAVVLLGLGLVLMTMVLTLLVLGLWQPFVAQWLEFTLPVYNQLFEPDTRWRVTKDLPWRLIHLTPLALLGLTRYRHPQYGRLVRVVALFFAVGFLSLLVQRRGWLYHCYPSVPPMLILTMIGLDALVRGPIVSWPRVRWLLSVVALGAVFLRPVLLAGSEVPGAIRDRAAGKPQPLLLADYMAQDMAPYVQPGDYVQTLDQVAGGLKALLMTDTRLPTRYIYAISVLTDLDTPFRNRARADMLETMRRNPPKVVLISDEQWPGGPRGYDRLERWEAFKALLDRDYVLQFQWPREGQSREPFYFGYRGYVRRDVAIAAP